MIIRIFSQRQTELYVMYEDVKTFYDNFLKTTLHQMHMEIEQLLIKQVNDKGSLDLTSQSAASFRVQSLSGQDFSVRVNVRGEKK